MEIFLLAVCLLALSLALTVGWVLMLVDAARTERWGWFVVMLVVSVTGVLYFFVEYGSTPRRRPAGAGTRARY